jgi:lysophospholipase L1-like esterase
VGATFLKKNHYALLLVILICIILALFYFRSVNFYASTSKNYNGKTWAAVGDSITAFNEYQTTTKKIVGFKKVNNYGLGGSSLASKNADDKTSVAYRVKHIDFSAEVITIFGGTNDWGNVPAKPLGKMGDTKETTVYGAIDSIIKTVLEKNPNTRLVFVTPLQREFEKTPKKVLNGWSEVTVNDQGYKLEDVVTAIEQVCSKYGIPVLDLYHTSGITKFNFDTMTRDGLHPSRKYGMTRIGKQIGDFINNL